MLTSGEILIRADRTSSRLQVTTRSTRTQAVAAALTGYDVRTPFAPKLLGTVFALCPEAHRAAWQGAIARALGQPPDARLELRVRCEVVLEHLRFLAFTAPKALHLSLPPDLRPLGALRLMLQNTRWNDVRDRARLECALNQAFENFVAGVPVEHFEALTSLSALTAWMRRGATVAARLLHALWTTPLVLPAANLPFLSPRSPLDAARWLDAPGFDPLAPKVLGRALLTGAVARQASHPLVAEMLQTDGGLSLRPLFAARLLEAALLVANRNASLLVRTASPAPREGIALVEGARGLLIHRLRLNRQGTHAERVAIVAPTEWNFAPEGAASQWLSALEVRDERELLEKARRICTGLDPCVPCRWEVRFEAPGTGKGGCRA